jgi:hypothetical protein
LPQPWFSILKAFPGLLATVIQDLRVGMKMLRINVTYHQRLATKVDSMVALRTEQRHHGGGMRATGKKNDL